MGNLNNILAETKQLLESTPAEQMQHIKAFSSANPELYKKYITYMGPAPAMQKKFVVYLEVWASKYWDGDLDFRAMPFKEYGSLQRIDGDLRLQQSRLEDLGQLQIVDGDLILSETPVRDLGQLRIVTGTLSLNLTTVESLGQLESVGGNLFLANTPLIKTHTEEQIRQQVEIEGQIIS